MGIYARWLIDEALPAGGIGPGEGERIWERHIAGSIAFSSAVSRGGVTADVGTGVGLPAIPLAVIHPASHIVAIDRSQRRIDLVARAIHILELENVEPWLVDIERLSEKFEGLTSRAVAGIRSTVRRAERLLKPGGMAIMGLSSDQAPSAAVVSDILELTHITIPNEVLDGPSTLLRMVPRGDRRN